MVLFANSGRSARLMGSALLITTFVAGALAGAAAVRVLSADDQPTVSRPEAKGPPMRGGPRRLLLDEQFTREIGLTEQQRAQIRVILDRRDNEAKQMWQTFEPRLKAFAAATHEEIEKVLTKEQADKLQAAIEERRAHWKKGKHCPGDSAKAKP